jgi:NADPH:quinone reductase-like Zn-dependent oxidoreductase
MNEWPGPFLTQSKQVRLRVSVAGLNQHDQNPRDTGFLIKSTLPEILGSDIVSVLTDIGPDTTKLKREVVGYSPSHNQLGPIKKHCINIVIVDETVSARVRRDFNDHDARGGREPYCQ